MNLVVDAGNTRLKLSVFENDQELLHQALTYNEAQQHLNIILNRHPVQKSIIASTKHCPTEVLNVLKAKTQLLEFTHKSSLPFNISYKTPNTLGLDRIALAAAAAKEFPQKDCLIIDAGTCVTYDFIDHHQMYHGGAISPGLQMRFKAMHTFTDKLPLIQVNAQELPLIGDSTDMALKIGGFTGLVKEIDGFIDDYLADNEDLTVILTGGDHLFLSTRLKNSIFATSNFLPKGLNYILEYNTRQ
jgi:type III pantothenate kinase